MVGNEVVNWENTLIHTQIISSATQVWSSLDVKQKFIISYNKYSYSNFRERKRQKKCFSPPLLCRRRFLDEENFPLKLTFFELLLRFVQTKKEKFQKTKIYKLTTNVSDKRANRKCLSSFVLFIKEFVEIEEEKLLGFAFYFQKKKKKRKQTQKYGTR